MAVTLLNHGVAKRWVTVDGSFARAAHRIPETFSAVRRVAFVCPLPRLSLRRNGEKDEGRCDQVAECREGLSEDEGRGSFPDCPQSAQTPDEVDGEGRQIQVVGRPPAGDDLWRVESHQCLQDRRKRR